MAAKDKLIAEAAQSPVIEKIVEEGLPGAPLVRVDIDREKAGALGVSFTRRQRRHLDPSRLDLRQRLHQSRTHAARDRAGRREQARPRRGHPDLQRAQQGRRDGSALGLRAGGVGGRADADRRLQRLPLRAPDRRAEARLHQRRRHRGNGAADVDAARAASAMTGPGSRCRKSSRARRRPSCSACRSCSCSCASRRSTKAGRSRSRSCSPRRSASSAAWSRGYLRGLPNDVYFTVGLITIIGLSAKNAILIIEFARDLRAQGLTLVAATIEAARLRFRPIVMTSLAFILGVVPLMIASGASAKSQQALGTGVFGGMISATVLTVFFVPVFFVAVMAFFVRRRERRARRAANLRRRKKAAGRRAFSGSRPGRGMRMRMRLVDAVDVRMVVGVDVAVQLAGVSRPSFSSTARVASFSRKSGRG